MKRAEIILKRPVQHGGAGKRATFALLRRAPGAKAVTLDLPELAALNRSWRNGELDFARAEKQVLDLKRRLLAEEAGAAPAPVFHSDNLKILTTYYTRRYAGREVKDGAAAYNELRRGVEAVGNLSLRTASQHELQAEIGHQGAAQARRVAAINRLLKFIGRDIRLVAHKKHKQPVVHITPERFFKIEKDIKLDWLRDAAGAAFGTGARWSEVARLEKWNVQKGFVYVEWQFDAQNGSVDAPLKNWRHRPFRRALVLPQFEKHLERWLARPLEERRELHRRFSTKVAPHLRAAAGVTFHDLRHSYVICLLGVEHLDTICDYIGDSYKVAKEYYAGFISTETQVANTRRKLLKKVKKKK